MICAGHAFLSTCLARAKFSIRWVGHGLGWTWAVLDTGSAWTKLGWSWTANGLGTVWDVQFWAGQRLVCACASVGIDRTRHGLA
jgi:hypothetical protein